MPLYPSGLQTSQQLITMNTFSNTSPTNGNVWYDPTQLVLFMNLDGITQSFVGTIFTSSTNKVITNTVTETSAVPTGVGSLTLPANFWVVGKTIRIRGGGVFSTAAALPGTFTVKVKYGSTVLATSSAFTAVANLSTQGFSLDSTLTCMSTGATGTLFVNGGFNYSTGLNLSRNFNDLTNAGATVTVNTTTSNLLDVTATWGTASASNILNTTNAIVEVFN